MASINNTGSSTVNALSSDTLCLNPAACIAGSESGDAKGESESGQGEACSFTAATVVTTAHGKEAIGSVHKGEKVLAYNPKTHTMEMQPIVHVWIHADDDLVDLTITTQHASPPGKSVHRTSEVVHTNKKHPFLTREHSFLAVGQITVGMHILRADGTVGTITQWTLVPGKKTMYNLEVAHDHTFTVGDGQWVVHNKCDRGKLRENLGLKKGDPYQAQHLIPCQLATGGGRPHGLVMLAESGGFDINSAENGLALPSSEEGSLKDNLPQHAGRHSKYTTQVEQLLNSLQNDLSQQYGGNIPPEVANQAVSDLAESLRDTTVSAGGGCTINDIVL